jgi:hypothetical protein
MLAAVALLPHLRYPPAAGRCILEDFMADHGQVEYATAKGNDLPAHEATYDGFIHLALVGSCHVISIVIALAIVGTTSHWLMAVGLIFVATLVAIHGLASGSKTPSGVMVVIALLTLGVAASG